MRAPVPVKIMSSSNVGSKKSTWPGKSQIWKLTKELPERSSLWILLVLSRKRVSFGDIFPISRILGWVLPGLSSRPGSSSTISPPQSRSLGKESMTP
ncbi:hypothetical protein CRUP_019930 [Coryphaenoides rupestris]|nr:hypothetical protein CRUP_019930 [Coryphaenoides rupestris]